MKKLSEGYKMFLSVMGIFLIYVTIFIIFEDYDRHVIQPLTEESDWHLLLFSLVIMALLGLILLRYAKRMDRRIHREQALRQNAMRRQLTQNIAHELKTPVASILGYTETLLDNPSIPEDTRQQFIRRSHEQAQRLTALLRDISTLNRMDFAPEMTAMDEVDVSALVAEIAQEVAAPLQRKEMVFHNSLPDGIRLMGNAQLLYSVFRNLLDNAILYAGVGTEVTLTAQEQADAWLFTFSDNGVGVPPEHLPRLFERFYRVDKGRSRELGGTGLGLAIVKNAVQLHGGTITASLSDGLTFRFTLKKDTQR